MDRRIGQRSVVNKLRGLAIPVVLATAVLASLLVATGVGATSNLIINNTFAVGDPDANWDGVTSHIRNDYPAYCAEGIDYCFHTGRNRYISQTIAAGNGAVYVRFSAYIRSATEVPCVFINDIATAVCAETGLAVAMHTVEGCVDIDTPSAVVILRNLVITTISTHHIDNVDVRFYGGQECAEEPWLPSGPVYTVPITATCSVTINGVEGVEMSANILENASFEESSNGVIPTGWEFRSPLYAPELWVENEGGAADGVAYLSQSVMPGNSINQDVFLPASPEFVIGVMVSNSKAFDGEWAIGLADQVVDGAGGVTSGYIADEGIIDFGGEVYSDTVFSLLIEDSLDAGLLNLDMVYMIPISDTGSGYTVYCPAVEEAGNNGQGQEAPPVVGNGYPTGTGAAAQCRTCPTPSSWLALGEWLAYGWCVVTSLFVCHLRVWIWEATNIILAFPAWVIAGVNTFNSLLGFVGGNGGWLATILELGIGTPYAIYNAGINFLVSMYAQLQLGMNLGSNTMMALLGLDRYFSFFFSVVEVVLSVALTARTILYAMFDYVQLALATLPVIQEAIASGPMPLDEFLGTYYEGEEAYTNTNVAVGTPSEATILMVIFWGMWLMDSILLDYHLWPLTWLAIAGIGFYTLYWLFKEWSSLFSSAQLD